MMAGISNLWTRAEDATVSQSASKKWSKRLSQWLVGALGIALGCLALNGRIAAKKLERFQTEMRQAGLPTSLHTFHDRYASQASDERKTATYSKALLGLTSTNDPEIGHLLTTHYLLDDPGLFAPKNRPLAAMALQQNAPVLQALHSGPDPEGVHFPIDLRRGSHMEMPHIPLIMRCARLLFLESVYAAQAGHGSNAVQSVLTLFKLGNTLAKEPVGRSQGARIYCNERAVTALEFLLNQRPLTLEQLIQVRRAVAEVRRTTDISDALLGELCIGMGTSQRLTYKSVSGKSDGSFDLEFMSLVMLAVSGESPDKLLFLETMRSYLDTAKLPYPKRGEIAASIED